MSVSETEAQTVLKFECWNCEHVWYEPMDDRGAVEGCPSCGAREGFGPQGHRFEVSRR